MTVSLVHPLDAQPGSKEANRTGNVRSKIARNRDALGAVSAPARKRSVRRLTESLQSLRIYGALIGHGRAMTVREHIQVTGIADGTIYPILQKRVAAGVLHAGERDGSAEYDLTPIGYEQAKTALLDLEVGTAAWVKADRKYAKSRGSGPRSA